MTTPFSSELESFVTQEVASGHFPDRNAVIECGLRLLQRDREEAIHGILAGLADVAAGRMRPLDEAFDELRREGEGLKGV
jgi:Arc/MetJ-type ribon-helix-helix transcriptional regulator